MGEDKHQDAFDEDVNFLLEIFPKRGSLATMDHLWEEGNKHLEQIASLARTWNDSQEKPKS